MSAFSDAKDKHPEDRSYQHPDFEKVIQKIRAIPEVKTNQWRRLQTIAEEIEDARYETPDNLGNSGAVTSPKKARIIKQKQPLDFNGPSKPGEAGSKKVAAKAPVEKPAKPKCEDGCANEDRKCKVKCGCTLDGTLIMCMGEDIDQDCLQGCGSQVDACRKSCDSASMGVTE